MVFVPIFLLFLVLTFPRSQGLGRSLFFVFPCDSSGSVSPTSLSMAKWAKSQRKVQRRIISTRRLRVGKTEGLSPHPHRPDHAAGMLLSEPLIHGQHVLHPLSSQAHLATWVPLVLPASEGFPAHELVEADNVLLLGSSLPDTCCMLIEHSGNMVQQYGRLLWAVTPAGKGPFWSGWGGGEIQNSFSSRRRVARVAVGGYAGYPALTHSSQSPISFVKITHPRDYDGYQTTLRGVTNARGEASEEGARG